MTLRVRQHEDDCLRSPLWRRISAALLLLLHQVSEHLPDATRVLSEYLLRGQRDMCFTCWIAGDRRLSSQSTIARPETSTQRMRLSTFLSSAPRLRTAQDTPRRAIIMAMTSLKRSTEFPDTTLDHVLLDVDHGYQAVWD
ncbi:hypothetical protein X742_32465 [Mesorhizobium sp. LNHC232B00]|nr:hypothetical protein X742_32465 [Mesorhizobium sp. LNHC232B00]